MNIDEQLLNDQKKGKSATDQGAARTGALNQARRGGAGTDAAGGQAGSPAGDQTNQPETLREAAQAEKIKQAKGGVKDKAVSAVAAPISRGTSKLLQQSWLNLIDSFGLTLIWINIHVFLGAVFGDKFFCKLGDEWGQAGPAAFAAAAGGGKTQMKSAKIVETVEPMGLACCDLGCLLIFIALFALVAIVASVLSPDFETIKALLGALWEVIKSIF